MEQPETPAPPPSETAAVNDDGAPLLKLDTFVQRPTVVIDGVQYEILSCDELSILDSHRFGMWGRRINALAEADDETSEAELNALIDKVARKVAVGIPAEIYEKLSGSHKLAISDVFTGLLLRNRLGVAGAIAKAAGLPWTGASTSPGSSASTADSRNGGWRKRLSRWFGLS